MSSKTFLEADVWQVAQTEQGYAVLLKPFDIDVAIPVFTGYTEARSTLISLSGVSLPIPDIHDLFVKGIKKTGNTIKEIQLSIRKSGIIDSKIFVSSNNEIIKFDAEPSDSVAIAAKINCKLYVSEKMLKETGISIDLLSEFLLNLPTEKKQRKSKLENSLFCAIKNENYEEAAVLRDKINRISNSLFID